MGESVHPVSNWRWLKWNQLGFSTCNIRSRVARFLAHQKYQYEQILEGLGVENDGIFLAIWHIYCHLVYFTAIWCTLKPFGKKSGHIEYFYHFVCCKNQTLATRIRRCASAFFQVNKRKNALSRENSRFAQISIMRRLRTYKHPFPG
jgi:hypothetical protein